MSAALNTGLKRRVEWEPGHGAAIASVSADSDERTSIGDSVRLARALPRTVDGRRV
jgi:hypothetical protein